MASEKMNRTITTFAGSAYKVSSIDPESLTATLELVGSAEYKGTSESDKALRDALGLKGASNVYLSHTAKSSAVYSMSVDSFFKRGTTTKILGGVSRTSNKYHVVALVQGEFDPETMTMKVVQAGEGEYWSTCESLKLAAQVTGTTDKSVLRYITKLVDTETRYMSVDDFCRYGMKDDSAQDEGAQDEGASE